ncbi:hypothetical protein L207DRAFT_459969 [Hyaloscypha variabilis F]|uniref:Uncharacterized protein n=1 Tax=Hyaloscypha variabilis (strain UAMH 11265 / GT02V1 / F) TaxID=1149755 RepID=A0A2J6RLH5_HYAVF|nr:hypothetical protein L207DRAFT_459969 [Hyaloscypha variabilis F]
MIIPSAPSTTVAHILSARATANNATTGDGRVGWVSAGSGRSTSDILWSCFSILLVCTWKCIHYNVPSIHESEARWHWWGILCWPGARLLSIWMSKVGWMIGITVAPEIGVALAMYQYLRARAGLKLLRVDMPRETGLQHVELRETESKNIESKGTEPKDLESINVDSKGVASEGTEPKDVASISVESKRIVSKRTEPKDVESKHAQLTVLGVGRDEITMAHTFFANMGGFIAEISFLPLLEQGKTSSNKPDETLSIPKTSDELILMIEDCQDLEILLRLFPDLRLPAKKDIEDLSKADSFTKVFACVQSTWLVVQSIARVSQGLPITQLELATMAFVVCALIMYMLWWHKPFGVDRRTVLTSSTYNWNREKTKLLRLSPVLRKTHTPDLTGEVLLDIYFGLYKFAIVTLKEIAYGFSGMVGHIFGRENLTSPPEDETRSITFYAAGTLFSAFHIGAWNWEFPSSVIRTLWRTFALAATGTGPAAIFLIVFYLFILKPKFPGDFVGGVMAILMFLLALIYIISRLALIGLIFYCFSSMPAEVYETVDWTKFLPHFS